MRSLVLQKIVQLLLPVTTVFAVYLLLYGHNQPGGGFVAGLVLTLGLVIHAIAFGPGEVRARLERFLRPAFGVGLLCAAASGLPAVVAGRPFLSHAWFEVDAPGGAMTLSTALVFDFGVLLVVVGAMSTALSLLAGARR